VPSNFRQWVVGSFAEIAPDLGAVGLPEYRLTVRPSQGDLTDLVFKGIGHRRVLEMAIEMATSYSTDACAVVEVDMRAHQNPARMKIISQLAERLAQRVAALT
jgi:hypothetical protein